MNTAIRIFVMTLAFGAATLAVANSPSDLRVRYSAHELESPAGVMALHDRLTAAVAQSCAPLDGRSLARLEAYRHCLSTLLAAAVRDVRSPALAALHEARTGEHIDVAQPVIQLAGETHPAGSVAR